LIPHARRVLNEFDDYCKRNTLARPVKHAVIELLITASIFSDTPWKSETINRAKKLLEGEDDQCLLALVAQRESALLRLYGDPKRSNLALERFLQSAMLNENGRYGLSPMWNARRGGLLLSYARNLTFDGETSKATVELQSWNPLNPEKPSTMERMSIFRRDTALARILREQGIFDEALHCLQRILKQNQDDEHLYENEGWRRGILASVADLHCELGQSMEADAVLRSELEYLTGREELNISNGRLLQLSLAESYILREMWARAEELLQNLEGIFTVKVDPDLISRTGLFRVWYAFARISHTQEQWREAYRYWHKALMVGQSCKWKDYPLNIVWLSLAHVCRELGNWDESYELEQKARESLARSEMKYWIVGIGTYWLKYVNQRMAARQSMVVNGAFSGKETRSSEANSLLSDHTKAIATQRRISGGVQAQEEGKRLKRVPTL
jgi:tetratricopeptide (TPR) repeat protein